jgi:multidrug resistance protein
MVEKEFKDHQPGSSCSIDSTSDHQDGEAESEQISTPQEDLENQIIIFQSARLEDEQRPIEYVPRHLKRGLFGRFALIQETQTPTRYPQKTKWLITAIIALAAAAAPMGSASVLPALTLISTDFHVSNTVTNLSIAFYMLAMSIFPLWWSSFSEEFGRRSIYIVSFSLFIVFGVVSAEAQNIGMFIAARLLSGGAAASVQAVGAGTIADIWEPRERGKAMGIFYLGPLCGPLFAPIIGGALAQGFGWRATQWFLVIFGGIVLVGLVFLLPETLTKRKSGLDNVPVQTRAEVSKAVMSNTNKDSAPETTTPMEATTSTPDLQRTSTRQSVKDKSKKGVKLLKRCLIDPLEIILLLRFPAVAVTVFYAAITFGSLYTLNVSIELSFSSPPYNFSTLIVGLLYIPNSIGYVLASIFGGRWLDHVMKREARKKGRVDEKGRLILRPEDRMRENAWLAAFMFPLALIWYGWTVEKGVIWIVPVSYTCTPLRGFGLPNSDDCQFLLRYWFHAHIRHGYDHIDRVYTAESVQWHVFPLPLHFTRSLTLHQAWRSITLCATSLVA